MRASLHGNRQAILRALAGDLVGSREHVLAHVREDEATACQPVPLREDGPVVQVELDSLVEEVRLADENVRATSDVDQRVRPLGVA
jgi:hypothetical protein